MFDKIQYSITQLNRISRGRPFYFGSEIVSVLKKSKIKKIKIPGLTYLLVHPIDSVLNVILYIDKEKLQITFL